MARQYLDPTYLEMDFQYAKDKLKKLMEESDTFKDYNYEGANITMLIELISYLNDMSTYYTNKIVKNIYPDSAEVYETMHSIASIRGYRPKGYIAPQLDLKVKVMVDDEDDRVPSPGDQLLIPAWFKIDAGISTEDGTAVEYMTTKEYTFDISSETDYGIFEFELPLKQGRYYTIDFVGEDIINNKLLLPSMKFDHDTTPYDENPSIQLYVNEEPWTRVENFPHSELSKDDNIYILEYDKYERYNIVFSPSHNIPEDTDVIQIILNRTVGPDGNISSNSLTDFELERTVPEIVEKNDFVYNERPFIKDITRDLVVNKDHIEIWNPEASFNSSNPESLSEIDQNSRDVSYSQLRNVNDLDYKYYLESHPDITSGFVWGEQEENPQNTKHYNNVYISIIPNKWGTGTVNYDESTWHRTEMFDEGKTIKIPTKYNENFKQDVLEYLESRKFLNTYEIFVIPDLVNFAFDIGLKVRNGYNFTTVRQEVEKKLGFYFSRRERSFNETIDFKEIENFMMDTSIRDENNERFSLIRGIRNFVFRDVLTYTPNLDNPETIFEPNEDQNYPQFTVESWEYDYDNILRPIKLGLKQFPVLIPDNCTFINER